MIIIERRQSSYRDEFLLLSQVSAACGPSNRKEAIMLIAFIVILIVFLGIVSTFL